jgi:hypothetical protein
MQASRLRLGKEREMARYERIRVVLAIGVVVTLSPLAWGKYGGGSGTPGDPYLIYTAEQMDAIGAQSSDWGKCFRLMADIDLGGYTGSQYHIVGTNWRGGFSGVFDGNGRTISHFTYACADVNCIGLFGNVLDAARIENLGLLDPNVSAVRGYFVGSLAGHCLGTVTNCYVTNAMIAGKHQVGGLVGGAVSLTNCHAMSVITGEHDVGGLTGLVWETATGCSATAQVTGRTHVGGLMGWNNGRVEGSFSAGSVSGAQYVGGLVGANDRIIANCYSLCDVDADAEVGGLLGLDAWDSTATCCYSAGEVKGRIRVGGLIAADYAPVVGLPPSIRACFWDMQTSGQATSDGGTGLVTLWMQTATTFLDAGWDFVDETANGTRDIWRMPKRRGYPRLSWEPIASEPNVEEPWWPMDDFEDGVPAPRWEACESGPDSLRVREVNGRLEFDTLIPADSVYALYLPSGWRLDATKDFSLKIDFYFDTAGAGEGYVSLGLARSPANPTAQYVDVAAGCLDGQLVCAGRLATEYGRQKRWAARNGDAGTLYLSYNAAADELYRSFTGYGSDNAWDVATQLLQGQWSGQPLYVIMGGSVSFGVTLESGGAWLDNFMVDSGVIIP